MGSTSSLLNKLKNTSSSNTAYSNHIHTNTTTELNLQPDFSFSLLSLENKYDKLINFLKNNSTNESILIRGKLNLENKQKQNYLYKILPIGSIVAYKNDVIPKGWVLCDGQNNTPDLRGRSIYGNDNKTITQGGTETHTLTINELPEHSHTLVNSIPLDHVPNNKGGDTGGPDVHCVKYGSIITKTTEKTFTGNKNFNNVSNYTTQPHNNMPPFYVLHYIMRIE